MLYDPSLPSNADDDSIKALYFLVSLAITNRRSSAEVNNISDVCASRVSCKVCDYMSLCNYVRADW
jgi:hypothetical protein